MKQKTEANEFLYYKREAFAEKTKLLLCFIINVFVIPMLQCVEPSLLPIDWLYC